MTIAEQLANLGAILEGLEANAVQFCVAADDLGPGELRGAFLTYAEALKAARGYLGAIQKLAETKGC